MFEVSVCATYTRANLSQSTRNAHTETDILTETQMHGDTQQHANANAARAHTHTHT